MEEIYQTAGLTPNKAQKEAINTLEGPVLIVAGPGTGKTQTLIFRTANLLLNRDINPENVLLCTFTKKAAIQLETRISNILNELDYDIDIGEMKINTIHGFCNNILRDNINEIPQLTRGYETLDENTQALFINNHFEKIVCDDLKINGKYFDKWYSKWRTINKLKTNLNKFTQELIEPEELIASNDNYMSMLGKAFAVYRDILIQDNYIDFAHMQYYCLDFLKNSDRGEELQNEIKYIMVDEYQDTNYLQELFVFSASNTDNLCVVGDEDQSLYRFRGATVRNLLEFPEHFSGCKKIDLKKNYRSHMFITGFCNEFMNSIRWGKNRFDKTIESSGDNKEHFYDSVFKIEESSKKSQARKVGKFINHSLENNIISDYSEAAILLSSVRPKHSKPYINQLEKLGIPVYCPRSRMFFEFEEIKLMVGVLAKILDIKKRGSLDQDTSYSQWMKYLLESKQLVEEELAGNPIYDFITSKREVLDKFSDGDKFDVLNLFYRILGYNPFKKSLLSDTTEKYNLGKFSRLLDEFIRFYLTTKIIKTKKELQNFKRYLFYSYLYYLHSEGVNEYEDEDKIVAKGAVPIMTIHQAKGLEFPIVIAGSLDTRARSNKKFEKKLRQFKEREPFEKLDKINDYDFMRKYYVSFTRAEDVLVLTSTGSVNKRIDSSYKSLIPYEDINEDEIVSVLEQKESGEKEKPLKKNYAVTADIFSYNDCPKKYEFYREVEFVESDIGNRMFGLLVHQCIEDINEMALAGKEIKNIHLESLFQKTYYNLKEHMRYELSEGVKKAAYNQVNNYLQDLGEEIDNIYKAELPLKISREKYYLQGKADLLLRDSDRYRLMDVKTQKKKSSSDILKKYKMQLGLYKFMAEEKHEEIVIDHSEIYWAGEQNENRYTTYVVTSEEIESFLNKCDRTIDKIESGEFPANPKDEQACENCDFNFVCNKE